jgi:Xaa-Pro aminopeptidase
MNIRRFAAVAFFLVLLTGPALAQRVTYPPEEFTARRAALCRAYGPGLALLFGATFAPPAERFRQDNDFYYLTGNEDMNAALVLEAGKDGKCEATLFLPAQNESQVRVDGPNALRDPDFGKAWGFTATQPLTYLDEFLARRRGPSGPQPLHVRLSERDEVDMSRGDKGLYLARRAASTWGDIPSEDAARLEQIRRRFPFYEMKDLAPHLDRLRVIKTPLEIEALRRNGQVSALGIRRAIEATRPGRFEYELEAEALYVFSKNGADGPAYKAIVGSGPNVNVWHYEKANRQLRDGDLVVMDFGASFGYQTMDITRTWPVSGKLDDLQSRAYRCVLEAQKAIIAAMKPGATRAQTTEICRTIYKKWGFEDQRATGAGHYVGLAVHDVGDMELPFAPGMVIAVEPIIEMKDRQLHVRIEDTVLVTAGEPEVLSAGVPKELDAVLELVGKAR